MAQPTTRSLFMIGLGFFAVAASWAAYNAYLPLMLRDIGLAATSVGFIMALDNIFALTLQPLFGMLSDRTRSPLGRRIPFALVFAPIAAITLILLPVAGEISVPVLVGTVVIFAIAMACWRAPIVALMPDLVAPENRSKANGVINFMGSLGNVLIFGIGGLLVARFSYGGPFTMAGILMIVAVLLLVYFVRENEAFRSGKLGFVPLSDPMIEVATDDDHVVTSENLTAELIEEVIPEPLIDSTLYSRLRNLIAPPLTLSTPQKRSLIFILVALFTYTLGSSAADTFVTTYLNEVLDVPKSRVTINLLPYLGASILFAIPAGYIGQWLGRRRSMMVGLAGSAVVFVILSTVDDIGTLRLLMPIYGVLWITVIVNALPLTVELGGVEHTGTLTAYYYLATSGGAVLGPILFGMIRDIMGDFTMLFIFAAAAFALGGIVLALFVRHGEAGDSRAVGAEL